MKYLLAFTLTLLAAASASAHFVWITPSPDGLTAEVVFSEDYTPDSDVDIARIKDLPLMMRTGDAAAAPIAMEAGEHALEVAIPAGDGTRVLFGSMIYGLYQHGDKPATLLSYHPKAILGDPFAETARIASDHPVELIPVGKVGAVRFQLLSHGSPVADARVTVFLPDATSEQVVTDAEGFTREYTQTGDYGLWSRATFGGAGEHEGKPYAHHRGYATLFVTVGEPATHAPQPNAPQGPMAHAEAFDTMPLAVASFGAVRSGDWLYVYGGHIARTHDYDTEAVTGQFFRKNLARNVSAWEHLPGGPALQGMNLAAHAKMVYRVGGMQPRNPRGEKADNYSVADCTRFNPETKQWEWLAPMPEGRSSHDVIVVDDKLYVIGGWTMNGRAEGNAWPESMLVLDLASPRAVWKRVEQPFARRALIVAELDGRIYVMGGMDDLDDISRRVDIYDTKTQTWLRGPDLIGEGRHAGFASAACVVNGKLYVSVAGGALLELTEDGKAWQHIGTHTPRIVHRLVPWGDRILIAGGADGGGNMDLIESIDPEKRTTLASQQ